jgi:hypothetical protein
MGRATETRARGLAQQGIPVPQQLSNYRKWNSHRTEWIQLNFFVHLRTEFNSQRPTTE